MDAMDAMAHHGNDRAQPPERAMIMADIITLSLVAGILLAAFHPPTLGV
jgi:hypothetical protein